MIYDHSLWLLEFVLNIIELSCFGYFYFLKGGGGVSEYMAR